MHHTKSFGWKSAEASFFKIFRLLIKRSIVDTKDHWLVGIKAISGSGVFHEGNLIC